MVHNHNIVDSGKHFVIDTLSRALTTETGSLILVKGDHNSKRYTFEIPRMVEGHDMSLCNRIEIHYDNIPNGSKEVNEGVYIAKDAAIDGEVVTFSWLISGNVTQLAGTVSFWINFVCTDYNDEIIYAWGTDVFKRVNVIDNNRNTDNVIFRFPDILELWKEEVLDSIGAGVPDVDIQKAVYEYLSEHPVQVGSTATIGSVNLIAANWIQSENSENLYYQIVSIRGVPEDLDIENCQVDLTPSVEQLLVFYEKDLTFVTENEEGTVTVFAIGQKPENDYTIQVTITEVNV